jgi:hypothetical protein
MGGGRKGRNTERGHRGKRRREEGAHQQNATIALGGRKNKAREIERVERA